MQTSLLEESGDRWQNAQERMNSVCDSNIFVGSLALDNKKDFVNKFGAVMLPAYPLYETCLYKNIIPDEAMAFVKPLLRGFSDYDNQITAFYIMPLCKLVDKPGFSFEKLRQYLKHEESSIVKLTNAVQAVHNVLEVCEDWRNVEQYVMDVKLQMFKEPLAQYYRRSLFDKLPMGIAIYTEVADYVFGKVDIEKVKQIKSWGSFGIKYISTLPETVYQFVQDFTWFLTAIYGISVDFPEGSRAAKFVLGKSAGLTNDASRVFVACGNSYAELPEQQVLFRGNTFLDEVRKIVGSSDVRQVVKQKQVILYNSNYSEAAPAVTLTEFLKDGRLEECLETLLPQLKKIYSRDPDWMLSLLCQYAEQKWEINEETVRQIVEVFPSYEYLLFRLSVNDDSVEIFQSPAWARILQLCNRYVQIGRDMSQTIWHFVVGAYNLRMRKPERSITGYCIGGQFFSYHDVIKDPDSFVSKMNSTMMTLRQLYCKEDVLYVE